MFEFFSAGRMGAIAIGIWNIEPAGRRGGGHALALAASKDLFPYFQVFTPPGGDTIALEPMTCNVNAFQNGDGLVTVPAAGDWTAAFRVEYYGG